MKIIGTLLILVVTITAFGQKEEEHIAKIREQYKEARANYNNYRKDKRELITGHTTEGGQFTALYDTSGIKIIEVEYLGEMGKRTLEYYYSGDKLYFVFEQIYNYNAPIYYDEEMVKESGGEAFDIKKSKIKANRYYFHKDKLFRWLDPEKQKKDVKSDIARSKASEILTESNAYMDILNK